MFARNDNGTSLKDHLRQDEFFVNNDTLTIIDDYNIVDIKDDAISFYKDSFRYTGVRNIRIYFQIKPVKDKRMEEIRDLAHSLGINDNKFLTFCVFLIKGFYPKHDYIQQIVFKKKNKYKLNKAIDFIYTMDSIGITVTLHPYSSLDFDPPFHGRYWLTDNKGYIVDGSLQTYPTGRVFAQLMDDENFEIIKHLLFDRCILHNANDFDKLTLDDLRNFKHLFPL